MFIKKDFYYELEEFNRFGIKAVYTTRTLGDVKNERDREKILKTLDLSDKKVYSGFQTHSSNIAIIDEKTPEFLEDTDGFITQREDVVIFTKYADCLPIYLYDKNTGAFGCVHSGWVGSFNGIGIRAIEILKTHFESKLEDIVVGFGIGISIENYEVSEEFVLKFKEKFKANILEKVFFKVKNRYYFDNQQFNYNTMIDLGIKKENIILNNLCTYRDDFHSYRRDREGSGRNGAYIFIDKDRK